MIPSDDEAPDHDIVPVFHPTAGGDVGNAGVGLIGIEDFKQGDPGAVARARDDRSVGSGSQGHDQGRFQFIARSQADSFDFTAPAAPVVVGCNLSAGGVVQAESGIRQDSADSGGRERRSNRAQDHFFRLLSGDDHSTDEDVFPILHVAAGRKV